ncbi:hypothetical protein B0H14DRAFT_3513105 [Mycena olivaceomarginata]|nr:hypothetical protein B0H14DRAFT_3513105 [Mycena olivaceomarginata]
MAQLLAYHRASATAAPSIQVNTVLAPQHASLFLPQNQASILTYGHINDYNNSQYFQFSQYYPSSSPSRPTGYKRPSSLTPLLGTSPKCAHLSTHYDNIN